MTVKKLKIIVFFSGMVFMLPFLTPYFLGKGLDAFEIMAMQGIFMGAIVIMEVPSGAFSDMYGRKKTLIIAFGAYLLAWISLIFAEDFISFIPYQLFFALGISFQSGTFTSYIYEIVREEEGEEKFGEILSDIRSWGSMAAFIGAIGGTLLFKLGGAKVVIIATLATYGIAFVSVCRLRAIENKQVKKRKRYRDILTSGFFELGSSEGIKAAVTESIILGGFLGTFLHFNQMILKQSGFPVVLNGCFIGATYLTTTFIMRLVKRIMKNNADDIKSLSAVNLIIGGAIIFLPFTGNMYLIVGILFSIFILNNARSPFATRLLNRNIGDGNRATTLSYISLIKNIIGMVLAPIMGYIYNYPVGFMMVGAITGAALIANAIILWRSRRRNFEKKLQEDYI